MTTTRFAPSPTGYLHIGNLRTALMNPLTTLGDLAALLDAVEREPLA